MSIKKAQSAQQKAMHSLASPFPVPSWPLIDAESQKTILDLFCQLLEPLGQHNRSVYRSKGKRKKRQRRNTAPSDAKDTDVSTQPMPEIASHLTIGFRSTHRRLEELVPLRKNSGFSNPSSNTIRNGNTTSSQEDVSRPRLKVVLVDRSTQPPIMISHLPTMLAVAARSLDQDSQIWLVTLPNGSENRLREVVGIPRIGLFGLMEAAPGSNVLMDYIKAQVPSVKPLDLSPSRPTTYLPLNVESKMVEMQKSKTVRRQEAKVAEDITTNKVATETKVMSGQLEKHPAKKQRK